MILEFQVVDGKAVPYSNQAKKFWAKQTEGAIVKLKKANTKTGSWPMLKTWYMWQAEIARHLAHNGRTVPIYYDERGNPIGSRPFDERDAHAAFTYMFLGMDNDGNRLSWKLDSDGGENVATKERRLLAMDKFVQYCAEQLVPITIPNQGDYHDYKEMQEA